MDSTSLEATLTELRPFTEYTISVVPFNQNGMGDPSNEIKVKTYSSTPSDPPQNVSLEATSSTVSYLLSNIHTPQSSLIKGFMGFIFQAF